MLQIAVWGIAMMLVIKGLDVVHRDRLAVRNGQTGATTLAVVVALLSFFFAFCLVGLASEQTSNVPTPPTFGNP